MEKALREAEVDPSDLDYVNAHATSTPIGDLAELKAIAALARSGKEARKIAVSSFKGATGHLLGASGAFEAAGVCLAMANVGLRPCCRSLVYC